MWTPATRKNYSRNGLRYQSDVTDEEWRVIEPYLPRAKGMGRRTVRRARDRQRHFLRDALWLSVAPVAEGPSALEHGLSLVCSWRDACLFEKINHALVITDRERVGREASPSAAIIDSQSIKNHRRLAARAVMMPARRSTGANVMRWLTRTGVAS